MSDAPGLSTASARRRLAEVGPNELPREDATPAWRILARQFASPMIGLLLAAATLSAVLREVADSIAIAAILLLNAVVGFFQEYRAERAVLALRAMTAPRARVRRDGRLVVLPAAEVVPGDVLVLEAGDVVAADARLLVAHQLATDESALTGESAGANKDIRPVAPDTPLAERTDHVYAGTAVASGSGQAEVEATGTHTELGRIAHLLGTTEDEVTPLQARLAVVSRSLVGICLVVVGIVAIIGVVQGQSALDVLLGAVSLAVAAVPEGLPAVVTIALAEGVRRMAARNMLVRRLAAVETLGATTVICTDKTGTLTTGKMTVREVWGMDQDEVVRAAGACCDAVPPVGDPTEVAIVVEARNRGVATDEAANPRGHVNPFDSDRKRMSVRRADGVLYVKGAVESVLAVSVRGSEGAVHAHTEMARRGLRVLAVAVGVETEADLTFLGLLGIADPPRTEAVQAVADARAAGITVVMITGDHPVTARAIALEMGIIETLADPDQRVHARVTPEQKLDLIRAWKERGAVVAMTGDGVNDAPALRSAHVGIAMGRGGTEVTREAADMVLADDNFASIVAAVREGRAIYDNIRKTLVYLLAGNAGELLVVLGAVLAGLPAPLLPLQLLWINLVTDGLPALALVMDPPAADVLARPPRSPKEPMLGRREWVGVAVTGSLSAAVCLGVYVVMLRTGDVVEARSMAFATLVFDELFRSFAARSPDRTLGQVGVFTNRRLLVVVGVSALLQLALYQLPFTQSLFGLAAIPPGHLLIAFALGLIPVSVLELAKLARALLGRKRRFP